MVLGVTLGLISGYAGGRVDSIIMRIADVQLSFRHPGGAADRRRGARLLPRDMHDKLALYVLILRDRHFGRVQYARTVRGSTLVERNKEYVQAARLIGIGPFTILRRHILPNVMGPVLVIATIHLAIAIITEAAVVSRRGRAAHRAVAGHADTHRQQLPVLGHVVDFDLPGIALVALVLSVNLLSDWLRDALNPKLR